MCDRKGRAIKARSRFSPGLVMFGAILFRVALPACFFDALI
ncbi:MAG: hypothetical protein ACYDH3_12020 [Candidatus Aminicenantales bacterium]